MLYDLHFFDLTIILLHPPEMQLGVAIYRHDKSPFLNCGASRVQRPLVDYAEAQQQKRWLAGVKGDLEGMSIFIYFSQLIINLIAQFLVFLFRHL